MDGEYLGESSYRLDAYLRIASLSIALYDFLETAPSTWRYTREQWNAPHISISFILFLLIQSTSIAAISLSNFGYFYSHFNEHLCKQFYLIPPVFKVLQSVVSQVILGLRGLGYSGGFFWLYSLLLPPWKDLLIFINELRAWTLHIEIVVGFSKLSSSGLGSTILLPLYMTSPPPQYITRMMLYDGVGYFTALTAVNVLNLVIYRAQQDIQTAAASLGYAATWIMTKRLMIHLHEISLRRRQETLDTASTLDLSRSFSSTRSISQILILGHSRLKRTGRKI
ncbi:hypothetical protein GYMLUDRAFT_626193 [Collybiopsis luxurians FD-317 M1]|nr:hypothetical protein GYMLUDRAFT_626193 [Collybiopsis luxurians FD-317 M1]